MVRGDREAALEALELRLFEGYGQQSWWLETMFAW